MSWHIRARSMSCIYSSQFLSKLQPPIFRHPPLAWCWTDMYNDVPTLKQFYATAFCAGKPQHDHEHHWKTVCKSHRCCRNVGLMLAQRLRHLSNIKPTLWQSDDVTKTKLEEVCRLVSFCARPTMNNLCDFGNAPYISGHYDVDHCIYIGP